MKRDGVVWEGDRQARLGLEKLVIPDHCGITVSYKVTNLESRDVSVLFAPEYNFAFSCAIDGESSEHRQVNSWKRDDKYFALSVKMHVSSKADIWTFPVETVSLSEGGFERTYQGTVAAVLKKLDLKGGASAEFDVRIEVADHKG
jgi:alpha-amylase